MAVIKLGQSLLHLYRQMVLGRCSSYRIRQKVQEFCANP
jgi:hypothetical protein